MVSRSETTFKNEDICIGACNECFVHKILSAILKPPFGSKWGPDLGGLDRGVIYFHFYILQKKHKDNVGVNTTHPRAVLAPGGVESVFLFQDNEKVKEPLLQSEAEASVIGSSESIMSLLCFCGFVPDELILFLLVCTLTIFPGVLCHVFTVHLTNLVVEDNKSATMILFQCFKTVSRSIMNRCAVFRCLNSWTC